MPITTHDNMPAVVTSDASHIKTLNGMHEWKWIKRDDTYRPDRHRHSSWDTQTHPRWPRQILQRKVYEIDLISKT